MTSRNSGRLMIAGAVLAGVMLGSAVAQARPCSEIQSEIQSLLYDRDRLQGELNRERDARRAGDLRFNIDHRNRQINFLRGQKCEQGGGGAAGGSGSGGAANPFGGGPVKNVPTVRTTPQGGGGAGCVVNLDGECVTPRR